MELEKGPFPKRASCRASQYSCRGCALHRGSQLPKRLACVAAVNPQEARPFPNLSSQEGHNVMGLGFGQHDKEFGFFF